MIEIAPFRAIGTGGTAANTVCTAVGYGNHYAAGIRTNGKKYSAAVKVSGGYGGSVNGRSGPYTKVTVASSVPNYGLPAVGDSGGPLLCNGWLRGVDTNANDTWPSYYTAYYVDPDSVWIKNTFAYQIFVREGATPLPTAWDQYYGYYRLSDFDGDYYPDLLFVQRSGTDSQTIEVHGLSGTPASNYQQWVVHATTPLPEGSDGSGSFFFADTDHDRRADLVFIKRTTNIEVHVLSAASGYQVFTDHTLTPLAEGEFWNGDFTMADVDRDGSQDLVFIKRRGGGPTIEVHTLSGASGYQTFTQHFATALPQWEDAYGDFLMSDVDRDGLPDLVFVQRRGNSEFIEVHALSGASAYQQFVQQVMTALPQVEDSYGDFTMSDANLDGHQDLVFIQRLGTSTANIEVHAINGGSRSP